MNETILDEALAKNVFRLSGYDVLSVLEGMGYRSLSPVQVVDCINYVKRSFTCEWSEIMEEILSDYLQENSKKGA